MQEMTVAKMWMFASRLMKNVVKLGDRDKCMVFRRVSQSWEKGLCLSVRPSTRMEKIDSHCTDFHEI
jgi:hypothetical protein